MSETRDQSYYEIALTNRQVMSIFIVLLVCLLASFVSGVWIGRQGAGVRVQTADAQRIDSGSREGEAPLGEMDFFSNRGSAVGSDAETETATDPPADAVPRQRRPVSQPARPASEPAPPVAEPAPAEPAPADRGRSSEPVATPSGGDFLYVQVFSSTDREQAQSIVERLRSDGYAAFLSSVEVDSRLMHRVRIGPYTERPEAEGVAQTVQRKHKLSTWITP